MTAPDVNLAAPLRAGRLSCFCPAGAPVAGEARGLVTLAGGFAASVLSQTLVLGLLPLAGLLLAPKPSMAVLPLVAMLLGAALATFPASFLLDTFGRRASFALGASHGLAGGCLMAWSLAAQQFYPLLLGAFWMGVAQGFSLFYRHEAAIGSSRGEKLVAIALVFGAGSLAGLVGPGLAQLAERLAPGFYVGTALFATAAQFATLLFAAATSRRLPIALPITEAPPAIWRAMIAPTLIAALAWFCMNLLMLAAPFSMVTCGVTAAGVMGAVAWHVVAMYAPSFLLAPLAGRINAKWIAALGLLVILLALLLFIGAATAERFTASLVLLAIGWSFTTTAGTAWLHEEASPSRAMLAVHDGVLFIAAIGGALAAYPFAPG
ncbi:MAG: MFS transporter [Beijerinckiaceae bacterium]|nr:MFS transporter [Beijerinckiaceae bacterium]